MGSGSVEAAHLGQTEKRKKLHVATRLCAFLTRNDGDIPGAFLFRARHFASLHSAVI